MIRRLVAATAAAALLVPLGPVASAAPDTTPDLKPAQATAGGSMEKDGPVLSLGDARGRELYVVQLEAPAVPTRGLDRSVKSSGPSTQKVPSEGSYVEKLKADQADLRGSIRRITGATPKVRYSYTQAVNGIAVELTRQEALRVSRLDGVAAVQVDEQRELQTERGPEWIGAPAIWDGTAVPGGVGSKGEGVIVGIIDSGLNPANPSFHDVVPTEAGGDGYDHTNPWGAGNYVGMCDPDSGVFVADWGCNDKLIGYWNFTTDGSVYDDDGHGSHTGSTTAGNQLDATTYSARGTEYEFSTTERIKGVAPHANIVGYDVCDGGCSMAAITAAIDQSITDDVDVLNYSIGSSGASNPWDDPDAIGFLNARAAGIHVATSAGNAGPGPETLGSPGDVPWMTTVGATTHNRQWQGKVQQISADGGATHPDISGVTFSKATDGVYPLVDSEALGNPKCLAGEFGSADLTDKIVVCERGGNGRVEKGSVVRALGAAGMVLYNDVANGDSLSADAHELPAVHIGHEAGLELKAWMASVTGEKASLSGGIEHVGEDVADIMAGFSSRGANRAVSMISPSVSAPGVDILAAYGADNEVQWSFISGTSMASPHTAGALALLKGVQPEWTPAEAQSALMTTAERDIRDYDGTAADWFDMGSGRIELRRAAEAGLVLDETYAGYMAANPAQGGDVRDLNTASMADNECLATCEWTRTLTGTSTGAGTWGVSVENISDGLTLSVDKSSIAVTDGGDVDVTVRANVSGAETGTWLFGTLVLTPPAGSEASTQHLPVAVLPSAGVLPDSVDITTRRDAGSWPTDGIRSIGFQQLHVAPSGLVPEKRQELSIPLDTTNPDPYDGNGTEVVEVQVPAGATRFLAKLENATAPDFDMFVGRGAVTEANVVCTSASGGSAESCEIANPEAGTWWVLVQNWEASSPTADDTVDLVTAVVAGDEGNLSAKGPDTPRGDGEPYSIRTFWNEDEMEAGQIWHGSLSLGTSAANAGNIGIIPVTVQRIEDDVTKTANVETAAPGDTVTYTVEVQPNVTPEDLTYSIKDTLPAGTTYVPGSATNGATESNGVISWSGTMESSFGEQGTYDITTSAQDPSCVNPLTGEAAYFDLESELEIAPQAAVSGDTDYWTIGSSYTYGHYGQQYDGVSFTDDGFLVYDAASNWALDETDEPWEPQTLPDPALPNNLKALLWQDMQIAYDAATNKGVSIASDGAGFYVVEYDDVHQYGNPAASYDMQFFVEPGSNDVTVAYDNLNGPLNLVTIGAEDLTGSTGQALVNRGDASAAISNDTVLCMTYESAMGDPATFTYKVKVNGDVHERQALVNSLVHSVDNPGAKPVTISDTVTVKGAKERSETALAIDPNRVLTGETTTATATVFSAGESEATGQVQFLIGGQVAGTATLDAAGKAKATLTAPAQAGVYPVVAKYLGDAGNHPSTSDPVNLVASAKAQPPIQKVKPKISIDAPKKVTIGKRKNLGVTVAAPGVTPSGKVMIKVQGAGKKKTYTVTLDAKGKATVKLPRYQRTGKVKVTVRYAGDAAVLPGMAQDTFRVVRRR